MSRGSAERSTNLLIAVVGVGGLGALAVTLLMFPIRSEPSLLRTALILIAVTAIAELIAIPFHHGKGQSELLTLFELAVVADIVLLPPGEAALVSIAGLALTMLIKRKPLVKYVFNLGQYALAVVPAIALFHSVGEGDFSSPAGLISLFVGMTLFTVTNFFTISAIIAATTDRSLRSVLAEERGMSFAMGVGNAAVGLVGMQLYLSRPELLPAVLAPTLAMYVAFRGWVRQQELRSRMEEESTKLGRILEHSSEGIVLADADGSVQLWSPSMEAITGVPAAEAVGKSIAYLLRGRNVYGRPVSVEVSGVAEPMEIEIVGTDGKPRWLRVQHGPGADQHGELSFDVLVVTDITRQREVDRLKEDFFATVSHELRTPLTPIKGYATLLLRRADDIPPERRQEALQSIVERTDHMARLVEDLLLASRIANTAERRMPEVVRQRVEVAPVVERALRSFRIAYPSREFRVDGPSEAVAVGDPIRIEQVVANLVSNAVKFSEDGTVVDIAVAYEPTQVRISVSDEGRGIPTDRLDEIFERFKRLEDPLRMETGGAGLGLYIVRELTRAMGGSVSVRSEVGRGSSFTVTLPTAAAAIDPIPQGRRSDDRPAAGTPGAFRTTA